MALTKLQDPRVACMRMAQKSPCPSDFIQSKPSLSLASACAAITRKQAEHRPLKSMWHMHVRHNVMIVHCQVGSIPVCDVPVTAYCAVVMGVQHIHAKAVVTAAACLEFKQYIVFTKGIIISQSGTTDGVYCVCCREIVPSLCCMKPDQRCQLATTAG